MPGRILLHRPYIEDDNPPFSHAFPQRPRLDRLEAVPTGKVVTDQAVYLRQAQLPQPEEDPEVLRGVGDAETSLSGQLLHRPLRLTEELEDLQPLRAGKRPADAGEVRVERFLHGHRGRRSSFNLSIES